MGASVGGGSGLQRQHSSSEDSSSASSHGHTPPASLSGHQISAAASSDVTLTPIGSRPMLKRAGSADATGGGYATMPGVAAAAAASPRHGPLAGSSSSPHHAALCRTGSQDTPHQPLPGQSPSGPLQAQQLTRAKSGSESPLTRSLPRI